MSRWELLIPPPLVALLCATMMWGLAQVTPLAYSTGLWRFGLATALLTLGLLIALIAVVAFHRARTTIHPQKPEQSERLVTHGIFRLSRNPMYLGMLLVLLAWLAWLAAPAAVIGPAAFIAWIRRFQIQPEERILGKRFGEAYAQYCGNTRRWL